VTSVATYNMRIQDSLWEYPKSVRDESPPCALMVRRCPWKLCESNKEIAPKCFSGRKRPGMYDFQMTSRGTDEHSVQVLGTLLGHFSGTLTEKSPTPSL
jgi:hypothetical protein